MRRRNNQDSQRSEAVELLDSDDQDQMIHRFAQEMDKQQREIHQAFRGLCIGSAILSICVLLFLELRGALVPSGRLFRWIHVLVTATLHVLTPGVALPSTPTTRLRWILVLPWMISLLLGSSILFHARRIIQGEDEISSITVTYHQGLLLGNFLTTLAALWLRNDSFSIQRSIEQLKEARYRHKSL